MVKLMISSKREFAGVVLAPTEFNISRPDHIFLFTLQNYVSNYFHIERISRLNKEIDCLRFRQILSNSDRYQAHLADLYIN